MPESLAIFVMTLEAVNALVPRLQRLMDAQMNRRDDIERRLGGLARALGAVPDTIALDDKDVPEVKRMKTDLVARVESYQSAWRELEKMGAVLKDARQGLVDFYGQLDGKFVWLCWKHGERAITHYHGLDEGFSGRKPIEPTMRQRLLN